MALYDDKELENLTDQEILEKLTELRVMRAEKVEKRKAETRAKSINRSMPTLDDLVKEIQKQKQLESEK